jgi:hypothetical protein
MDLLTPVTLLIFTLNQSKRDFKKGYGMDGQQSILQILLIMYNGTYLL